MIDRPPFRRNGTGKLDTYLVIPDNSLVTFLARGNSPSYGTTFQKMGHELLSRDELAVLDGGKCILQLRGVRPFLSDKYDLTQHPNYKLTSDYDPKNTFDIEMCIRDRYWV